MKKNILIAIVILILAVAAILAPKFLTKPRDKNSEIENTVTPDATSSAELAGKKSKKATTATISIKDFAFSPANKTISKGTKVTWINNDSASHTIMGDNKNGPKSQLLNKDSKYSFAFNKTGKFAYYCSIHPTMKGTITVK